MYNGLLTLTIMAVKKPPVAKGKAVPPKSGERHSTQPVPPKGKPVPPKSGGRHSTQPVPPKSGGPVTTMPVGPRGSQPGKPAPSTGGRGSLGSGKGGPASGPGKGIK